jgi:hypothetical protein
MWEIIKARARSVLEQVKGVVARLLTLFRLARRPPETTHHGHGCSFHYNTLEQSTLVPVVPLSLHEHVLPSPGRRFSSDRPCRARGGAAGLVRRAENRSPATNGLPPDGSSVGRVPPVVTCSLAVDTHKWSIDVGRATGKQ